MLSELNMTNRNKNVKNLIVEINFKCKNNIMKTQIKLTLLMLLAAITAFAEKPEFNKDARAALRVEAYTGVSASFAVGNYIRYQKSYFNVTSPNTVIKGSILPNVFFNIGAQVRWTPFQDKLLSNLSMSVGLGYFQRGFTSRYKAKYTTPDQNLTDKTVFEESYRLNHFTIPIHFRWGKKWYAEIGFSINPFIAGYRWHKVNHQATGKDAYLGGYNETARNRVAMLPTLFGKKPASFDLGGGIDLPKNLGLRLQMQVIPKAFGGTNDFHTILLHLQLVYNIGLKSKA